MALWETGERNASQTLPQDRLADVCQSKWVTISLPLRTKHDIYVLVLKLIFDQNKSVESKLTLKRERCSPGGRNVLCTWHERWRDPADCTASYKIWVIPTQQDGLKLYIKILNIKMFMSIRKLPALILTNYAYGWGWTSHSEPTNWSPHLRKTGALQIQNCITDNVMNNNSLVHPGLTNVIGSAQEVNQKWGITHLWHYGLMKDHQDLLVHAAR